MFVKSPSNALLIVAVKTSVPQMNATPRMIATPVSTKRTLWERIPLTVTFHMGLFPQALHPVEHAISRWLVHLVDDLPVGEEHDPVRVAGRDRVVRDHDDRLVQVRHRVAHERED